MEFTLRGRTVWLNYSDLAIEDDDDDEEDDEDDEDDEDVILYLIDENGNYIAQQPDDVDLQGKRMKLYIDHFSRYAIGAE